MERKGRKEGRKGTISQFSHPHNSILIYYFINLYVDIQIY